ncbi:MAG TPA: hypothetical protein VF173_29150 [Thermoanaerobaculia bacterium]|nr:hypothetical protein [Thermoanaerobaculia bacterium]
MARNDLNVVVNNSTSLPLNIATEMQHGLYSGGQVPTLTGNPNATPPVTATATLPVTAAGEGSNIFLYITSGQNVWGIVVAVPSNKGNYFQYVYYGWPKAEGDTLNAANGSQEYNKGGGNQSFFASNGSTAQGTQVNVSITGTSDPATCTIDVIPAS